MSKKSTRVDFACKALRQAIAYAIEHCPLDPTFAGFVDWCRANGVPVSIVSDGLGFYPGRRCGGRAAWRDPGYGR